MNLKLYVLLVHLCNLVVKTLTNYIIYASQIARLMASYNNPQYPCRGGSILLLRVPNVLLHFGEVQIQECWSRYSWCVCSYMGWFDILDDERDK